jgi:hypothetical protein
MRYIPKAMQDIAKRDGRSVKQPNHSANKDDGNENQFRLPSVGQGPEVGSETQVEGGNHDKKGGPENLFPLSLEKAPKDEDASYSAEQTDHCIQKSHDESAN